MNKTRYHIGIHFIKPLLKQKFYLFAYFTLQIAILIMVLTFAKGKPIWHDISTRHGENNNHALVPVYQKESNQRIRKHFELVRQSTLQANNPGIILEQVLNIPKIQQLNLNSSQIESIYTLSERLLNLIYNTGYLHDGLPKEAEKAGFVLIREYNKNDTLVASRKLITKDNLHSFLQSHLNYYDTASQLVSEALVELFLQQNLVYIDLERHMVQDISPTLLVQERIGITMYVFLVALLLLVIIYYLHSEQIIKLHRYEPFAKRYYALLLLEFLAILFTFIILVWPSQPSFAPRIMLTPGLVFGFMITFLFGYRHGILFSLYYVLIIMLAVRFEVFFSIYLLTTMPFAVYLASLCRTRSQLFFASFWQAIMNSIIVIILTMSQATEDLEVLTLFVAMLSGLLTSPIALGISPVIESLLNLPSGYRLLDLCNLNAPTLRRLQYLAPGTYTHSLNVAILAENACQNIGANGLIARVSAYYHDIGKMENPEYFVENQVKGSNKHNQMKANLSAAIIRAHVRVGYEMGKEVGLPQEILDIILQHHGKSLVSFFYTRAKDELSEHEQSLNEADFRYPGPSPRTKESAIIMLADSVEAASHTLKKPSQNNIEKLVDDIIVHKIDSKELDSSPLTLKDISSIKQSLIQSLVGQYHHRIDYPESKNK